MLLAFPRFLLLHIRISTLFIQLSVLIHAEYYVLWASFYLARSIYTSLAGVGLMKGLNF